MDKAYALVCQDALYKELALDALIIMSNMMEIYEENAKLTFSCKKKNHKNVVNSGVSFVFWVFLLKHTQEESDNGQNRNRQEQRGPCSAECFAISEVATNCG